MKKCKFCQPGITFCAVHKYPRTVIQVPYYVTGNKVLQVKSSP